MGFVAAAAVSPMDLQLLVVPLTKIIAVGRASICKDAYRLTHTMRLSPRRSCVFFFRATPSLFCLPTQIRSICAAMRLQFFQ